MPGLKLASQLKLGAAKWHFVDAKDMVLGRIAADIAPVLLGKHKPIYTPHKDCGDYVVVINARHVKLTGRKWDNEVYRWHTGFAGGLKERSAKWMRDRKPEEIIRLAVHGMMPKNRLKKFRIGRLKVYADADHPHASQLGLNPKDMIAFKPREKLEEQPVFEGIDEFKGTEEEFFAIREAGSSFKKDLKYGIYRDEDHPDVEKEEDEFGDD